MKGNVFKYSPTKLGLLLGSRISAAPALSLDLEGLAELASQKGDIDVKSRAYPHSATIRTPLSSRMGTGRSVQFSTADSFTCWVILEKYYSVASNNITCKLSSNQFFSHHIVLGLILEQCGRFGSPRLSVELVHRILCSDTLLGCNSGSCVLLSKK